MAPPVWRSGVTLPSYVGPCSARARRDVLRSGIRSKRRARYPTDAAKPFATVATLST